LDLAPLGEGSMLRHVLDIGTIRSETPVGRNNFVSLAIPLAHVDLLMARELEFGAPKSLND
jgi:hypothetical protein